MYYCLFSFLIFSLLATSSIKLESEPEFEHYVPKHTTVH